jgi:antitoxin component YwqK of YwqJK toxin-antitoxin module
MRILKTINTICFFIPLFVTGQQSYFADNPDRIPGSRLGTYYPPKGGVNIPSLNQSNTSMLYNGNSSKNTRPGEEYTFLSSIIQEDNYWKLILKDSNNTVRMKGSYSDKELTNPDGMFYYYHSNGNTSMYGMYKQGQRDGIWISHYVNGKLKDSISYLNGKKNGRFQRYHLDGSIYISGNYVEDNMHGEWLEFYPNNQPASITTYVQNRIANVIYYTRKGEKIEQDQHKRSPILFFNRWYEIEKKLINATYYGTPVKLPNGKVGSVLYNMEGQKIIYAQWSDQTFTRKSGPFQRFDTTGILRLSCLYENNQLSGPLRGWHKTGLLSDSGSMKNNLRVGTWETWYESGMKKDSGAYEINKLPGGPSGVWSYWDESNGNRTIGAYGKSGKTGDWKTYDKNGKILFIQRYRKLKYDESEMIVINKQ